MCTHLVDQSCLTLCDPVNCSLPGFSVGFSRQEYWSGLPFPPPGDLPDPGINLLSLMSPALADRLFTTIPPGKPSLTYFPITSKAFVLLDWVEFGLGGIGSLPCSPFLLVLGVLPSVTSSFLLLPVDPK